MRTLIDTCVLSELRRPAGSARVVASFAALADDEVFLSVLTIGELRNGIDRLRAGKKKRGLEQWLRQLVAVASDRILPINLETAVLWGELAAKQKKSVARSLPSTVLSPPPRSNMGFTS